MNGGPPVVGTRRRMSVAGAARSLLFCVTYLTYLLIVMGPVQALILVPWVRLRPERAGSVWGRWQRAQAGWILRLARWLAGVEVEFQGRIPPVSCILVVNHQSLLDVPIAFLLVEGPTPLVPARDRYFKTPVIGPLMRHAGHPMVAQGRSVTPAERAGLERAADAVARGDRSLIIFPEGHRSPEGRIRPFMKGGLRMSLARAPQRPVYVALIEGLAHVRTFGDLALRLAGTRGRVTVEGPFAIPADPDQHEAFIATLRGRMLGMLAAHRGDAPDPEPADAGLTA
jgi:1-acyl-sn-glycerol-3-phosphate acyltransferase